MFRIFNPTGIALTASFLLELGKGLCPVANSYTLVLVSLSINSFSVVESNQL